MNKYRFIMIGVIVIALTVVLGPVSVLGQNQTAVAILVVDVFEEIDAGAVGLPIEVLSQETEEYGDGPVNCALAADGQDGVQFAGGATSVFHPYSQPHGRLIFQELQYLLEEVGATLDPNDPYPQITQFDGLRDVEQWIIETSPVWLVAVDTHGYRTDLMRQRIEEAIATLSGEWGITRFVINMSFALVPCEHPPDFDEGAYAAILDDLVPGDNCQSPANDFAEFKCMFVEMVDGYQNRSEELMSFTTWLRTEYGENYAAVYAFLHSRLVGAALADIFDVYYPDPLGPADDCAEFDAAIDRAIEDLPDEPPEGREEIYRLASAALEASDVYYLDYDPLFSLFSDYVPSPCTVNEAWSQPTNGSGEPIYVIPVASAGNEGDDFSYAPGYWPTVLSVSAHYCYSIDCAPAEEQTLSQYLHNLGWNPDLLYGQVQGIRHPSTNSGEVIENGVAHFKGDFAGNVEMQDMLGCLTGTSFAAPRVSVQAALFLAHGGTNTCSGVLGESSPPLSHQQWDNQPVPAADFRYCNGF